MLGQPRRLQPIPRGQLPTAHPPPSPWRLAQHRTRPTLWEPQPPTVDARPRPHQQQHRSPIQAANLRPSSAQPIRSRRPRLGESAPGQKLAPPTTGPQIQVERLRPVRIDFYVTWSPSGKREGPSLGPMRLEDPHGYRYCLATRDANHAAWRATKSRIPETRSCTC